MSIGNRRVFGSQKYAAFSLLFARWLRSVERPNEIKYVTLGGTELADVLMLYWIDNQLFSKIESFEFEHERFVLAQEKVKVIQKYGIDIHITEGSIFEYERLVDTPHIYFVDFEGTCNLKHVANFQRWFEADALRPNDLLLVTSYLGRNPGWDRTLQTYDAEFRLLRITEQKDKKILYGTSHPLFVVYESLIKSGLSDEILLSCLGYLKYKDTSPMGLYGITISEGFTNLQNLIGNFPTMDMTKRSWSEVTFL